MKLTCKLLKTLIPQDLRGKVYKSGSDVRINLEKRTDSEIENLRSRLKEFYIEIFRDDLVHLSGDYVVEFRKEN